MKFSFENIGLFQEKNTFNLKDLTIICGQNDSGKSTLNKLIYSAVKCIDFSKNFEIIDEIKKNLEGLIIEISRLFRNVSRHNSTMFDNGGDSLNYDIFIKKMYENMSQKKIKEEFELFRSRLFTDVYENNHSTVDFSKIISLGIYNNNEKMNFVKDYLNFLIYYMYSDKNEEINDFIAYLDHFELFIENNIFSKPFSVFFSITIIFDRIKNLWSQILPSLNLLKKKKNEVEVKNYIFSLVAPLIFSKIFNSEIKSKFSTNEKTFFEVLESYFSFQLEFIGDNFSKLNNLLVKNSNDVIDKITYCENLTGTFENLLKDRYFGDNESVYVSNVRRQLNDSLSPYIYKLDSPERDLIKKIKFREIINRNSEDSLELSEEVFKKIGNQEIDEIIEKIVKITNFDKGFEIKGNSLRIKKNGSYISAFNLSKGITTFQAIIALLKSGVFTKNSIVILDEVENFLNPLWQNKIIEIFLMIIEKTKTKIVLSSHSSILINALETKRKKYPDISLNFIYIDTNEDRTRSRIIEREDIEYIGEKMNEVYEEMDEEIMDGI